MVFIKAKQWRNFQEDLKLGAGCVIDQDFDDLRASVILQGLANPKGPVLSVLTPETKVSMSDFKISNFWNVQNSLGGNQAGIICEKLRTKEFTWLIQIYTRNKAKFTYIVGQKSWNVEKKYEPSAWECSAYVMSFEGRVYAGS